LVRKFCFFRFITISWFAIIIISTSPNNHIRPIRSYFPQKDCGFDLAASISLRQGMIGIDQGSSDWSAIRTGIIITNVGANSTCLQPLHLPPLRPDPPRPPRGVRPPPPPPRPAAAAHLRAIRPSSKGQDHRPRDASTRSQSLLLPLLDCPPEGVLGREVQSSRCGL
jgi:hypothetical protein